MSFPITHEIMPMPANSPFSAFKDGPEGWQSSAAGYRQQSRPCRAVTKLVIQGSIPVYFVPAATAQLIVAGLDTAAIDSVKTNFAGDTLTVGVGDWGAVGDGGVTIIGDNNHVSVNSINAGAATVGLAGRVALALAMPRAPEIKLMGSGSVCLTQLDQDMLEITIQCSGDVDARGQVATLMANVMGSGELDAHALHSDSASLTVTGSGDITARVDDFVRARVSGSGDIVVRGNPPVRRENVTGSGRIRFRN